MKQKFQKYLGFISDDLWNIKLKDSSTKYTAFIKILRVFVLTIKSYRKDKCYLQASALTFYTIMSIVPIFAMLFGIASGFGLEETLETQLLENFASQKDIIENIMVFAKKMLAKTSGGLVAGIGVIFLFWSVIKVLGNVEKVFNDIWSIKRHRTLIQKFNVYLSVMVICPFILVIHSSLNCVSITISELISNKLDVIFGAENIISYLIIYGMKILPYCFICLVLAFIYLSVPNTKVKFKSSIIAGIIAGVMFQLLQVFYVMFQVTLTKQNEIYGVFVALPLFLVWLQFSWIVVLFGAEISYAIQNMVNYEFSLDSKKVSNSLKRILSIHIAKFIIDDFATCAKQNSIQSISKLLEIPLRLTMEIVKDLNEVGIIVEIKNDENKEHIYTPAIPIENITIAYICEKLDSNGFVDLPVLKSHKYKKIEEKLSYLKNEMNDSSSNIALKDIC